MKRQHILVLLLMSYSFLGGYGYVMALQKAPTKVAEKAPDTKPAEPLPLETVKIQSEADRYHHQSITNKYALDEQKINNLVMQFLNSNEEAKKLQADMRELNDEMASLLDKMYKDHMLKQEDYEIKGDPPQFVRRAKK